MYKKNKKEGKTSEKNYMSNAASAGDCTGLMQKIPDSLEEYASFHDIYDFGPVFEDDEDAPFYGIDEDF